jgi:DNA replication protein DnaC
MSGQRERKTVVCIGHKLECSVLVQTLEGFNRHDGHHDYIESDSPGGHWCPSCIAEEKMAALARASQERIQRYRGASGIPRRFAECSFENYITATKSQRLALKTVRRFADEFETLSQSGRCLTLLGGVGTGKTHLGCAIVSAVIARDFRAVYSTAPDLLRAIKDTWRRDSERTEAEVIAKFLNPALLVIDEVGASYSSDTEAQLLFQILDGRYQKMFPTVVITNCDGSGLQKVLGVRSYDRLCEKGNHAAVFDWGSWRTTDPHTGDELTLPMRSSAVQ